MGIGTAVLLHVRHSWARSGGSVQAALGGLTDPHILVEVRVMLRLAPQLLGAFFYVLVLRDTLYSTCSIVLHCIAGYTSVSVLVY